MRFVNGITDAELVDLMGSAEVACVPSLYEGFSLPTAELMACETPLVVSRAGAIPEVVGPDGECADLVTPGDVGELYDALAALLDDPERRARMGAAGRRRVLEQVQLARGRGRHRRGVRARDRAHRTTGRQLHADRRLRPPRACTPASACSTWAAAPAGTPSRCTGAAPTSSRSTRTPTSSRR